MSAFREGHEPRTVPSGPPIAVPDHELIQVIGRGAYGEVWMARNAVGTLRAVKLVFHKSFQQREHFEREFNGLLNFEPLSRSHRGLVNILQLGRRDEAGYFYYVMELADSIATEGQGNSPPAHLDRPSYIPHTLRSEIRRLGRLAPAVCVDIGGKLAEALSHLHTQGLVHRDIKPSNIIFVNGEPKLADIGLVTDIDEANSLVGTPGYIPPEGPGMPQADLYSLGKVLYEAAFGKDRREFPQLPANLASSPDYVALLEFNEVVLKACETDPRRRYAHAAELGADLGRLRDGQSIRRRRRREQNWAIFRRVAAAVGLLVAAFLSLRPTPAGHRPNPEALRLYREGQWQYSQLTPEAHLKAYNLLNQAVQADPQYVQPYGEMTALYTWLMIPGVTNEQIRLERVHAIAERALKLDKLAPEGHVALSWCNFLKRDWTAAEVEIQRAIDLQPDFALAHDIYCFYLSMQCRHQEAHREGRRAVELRPPEFRRSTAIIAAWPYMAERRFDLAIVQLQQVLDLDPKFSFGLLYVGLCQLAQSNFVAAIDSFKSCALQSEADSEKVIAIFHELRAAYEQRGADGYFRKWIELMQAQAALPESERTLSPDLGPDLAGAYAKLGETDRAIQELESRFDESQVWHQIKFIPEYDGLHADRRFKALVLRAGLTP